MRNRISYFVLRGALLAAALGLAAWALLTMRWQGDMIDLFSADLPAVRDLRALQARGSEDFSLLGVVLEPGAEDSTQLATRLTKVADALAASPLVAKAEVLTDPSRLSPEGWAAVFIGLPPQKFSQFANATSEAEIHARLHTARDALGGWPDPAVWARIHYDPLGLSDYVVTTSPSAVTGPPPSAPNPFCASRRKSAPTHSPPQNRS